MTREEELKQIKKESAEMEKHMTDMFDLAFMLNNRNDVMNPQAHYEKLSRMVTHYMGSIQQSYGYMSIKAIEALEQEPIEVEATKLQMTYNQGFEDCRKAVIEAMYELCDEGGTLKENPWRDNPHIDVITDAINNLPPVNPQEPKTGHWIEIAQYSDGKHKIECSECKSHIFDRGHANSLNVKNRYKYCPNCGCRMVEPQERSDKE